MSGGNGARRKGSRFELDVVDYLRAHGFPHADRAYGAGRHDDRGDIDGVVGWVLEAKNHQALELARWVDEAAAEAASGPAPAPGWPRWAVIAKRRNKPVAQAYVVLSLETFAALVGDEQLEQLEQLEEVAPGGDDDEA